MAWPTSQGWSRPRKRTTGRGGFLTTPGGSPGLQLRAQCRMFAGFPLRRQHYTAGPWSWGAKCAAGDCLVKQSALR